MTPIAARIEKARVDWARRHPSNSSVLKAIHLSHEDYMDLRLGMNASEAIECVEHRRYRGTPLMDFDGASRVQFNDGHWETI